MYCDIFSGNFKGNILIPEKLFITSRLVTIRHKNILFVQNPKNGFHLPSTATFTVTYGTF